MQLKNRSVVVLFLGLGLALPALAGPAVGSCSGKRATGEQVSLVLENAGDGRLRVINGETSSILSAVQSELMGPNSIGFSFVGGAAGPSLSLAVTSRRPDARQAWAYDGSFTMPGGSGVLSVTCRFDSSALEALFNASRRAYHLEVRREAEAESEARAPRAVRVSLDEQGGADTLGEYGQTAAY